VAYILDKKVVTDTEEFSNQAYGITLPVQRGNNGFFASAFTSFEQAKSNLKNLLLTRKGERIFQPNFGSGIHELLFEQATDDLEGRLQENITDSVNFWLPYINIDTIEVNMTDEMKDRYTAEMKIQFTVGNVYEPQEITFLVEG
jgi:phage baseplate assembly protein W|tara:strand:- start:1446 stop:1877 length:432 start_codon:yes stop_codon:yes gene_type:complete